MSNAQLAPTEGAMIHDNEITNRGTAERSPFLDAYLEFDQELFKAIRLRDRLLAALGSSPVNHKDVRDRTDQVLIAWEAAERAVGRMAETKDHPEQALSEHAACLLEQNGDITADVLEQAACGLADDAVLARVTQLRERVHVRRASNAYSHADGQVQP